MDRDRQAQAEACFMRAKDELSEAGFKTAVVHTGTPQGMVLSLLVAESSQPIQEAYAAHSASLERLNGAITIERYNELLVSINAQLTDIANEHFAQCLTGCADDSNPRFLETRLQHERLTTLAKQLHDRLLRSAVA